MLCMVLRFVVDGNVDECATQGQSTCAAELVCCHLLAELTHPWLLAAVSLQVLGQVRLVTSPKVTNLAQKGLLTRVRSLVPRERRLVRCAVVARQAREGLLSSVRAKVLVERRFFCCTICEYASGVR
jgi:hypothetical protein